VPRGSQIPSPFRPLKVRHRRVDVVRTSLGPAFDTVLAAARTGAGWARTRLYEWLAPAVAGYVRSQGIADPSDVTSDVFVAVLTRLPSFEGTEEQFRSWVFTIAYRRVVDEWRTRSRRDSVMAATASATAAAMPSTAASAEDGALARLGDERVAELLATLTPDQRQVLALRVVADLSLEQVAELVGKPVGAVKALQHRALAGLRRSMTDKAVSR
jgi:RNA polymerase sigma factor (sigma-70 family)